MIFLKVIFYICAILIVIVMILLSFLVIMESVECVKDMCYMICFTIKATFKCISDLYFNIKCKIEEKKGETK